MKKLAAGTVRQIASAQVITSVFSVVKELVENSLDAGATCIEIKLDNYGFNKIEVRDNGCGIKADDTPYMALPHYTSKICGTEDLQSLLTYGFRGEALGALCNVADVTITTKTASDDTGSAYTLNNSGEVIDKKPSHLSTGTTVAAAHLFRNLPVRKQYYSSAKKCREELKRVEDLVIAYSVVRHDVRFWVRHNKDLVFQNTAVSSPRDVLIKVLGTPVMACMEKLCREWTDPQMRIELYLPKKVSKWSQMSRSSRDRTFIYVNKRPIEMKNIEKVLKQYYNKAMESENRWPMAFISIHLPPEVIDVNLEPNKTRVMIQQQLDVPGRLSQVLADLYGPLGTVGSEDSHTNEDVSSVLNTSKDSTSSHLSNDSLLGIGLLNVKSDQAFNKTDVPAIEIQSKGVPQSKAQHLETTSSTLMRSTSKMEDGLANSESAFNVEVVKHSVSTSDEENTQTSVNIVNSPHVNSLNSNGQVSPTDPLTPGNLNASYSMMDTVIQEGPKDRDTSLTLTNTMLTFDMVDDDFLSSTQNVGSGDTHIKEKAETECQVVKQPSTDQQTLSAESVDTETGKTAIDALDKHTDVTKSEVSKPVNEVNKLLEAEIENPESIIKSGDWNKGTSLADCDGKLVQPVMFIAGRSNTIEKSEESKPTSSLFGNSTLRKSFASVATPVSKLKASVARTPDQPSLFDVMGSGKRSSPGFLSFSKEIRPNVIKENSGASLQDIAKVLEQRWDDLSPCDRENYESMADPEKLSYREEKRKLTTPGTDVKVKKRKLDLSVQQKKSPKQKSQEETVPVPEVPADFSLARLKQLYQNGIFNSQPSSRSTKLALIGQLKTTAVWLGVHDDQICAFYPVRAQETLIYQRLLANHALPTDRLAVPMQVLPSSLGDRAAWLTLLSLQKSDMPRTDVYTYYNDPRLVKNGFNLRQYQKGEETCIEITGMFQDMNLYGMKDLQEILQAIKENPACQLQDCRTSKIRQFLQGEAVRMARQLPQRLSREETKDVLEELYKQLPVSMTTCFHNKPFLKPLYDLQSQNLSLALDFSPTQSQSD